MSRLVVVVTGSRTIDDIPVWPFEHLERQFEHVTLLHGTAQGVDRSAARIAKDRGWRVFARPAAWEIQGRRAGLIRNAEMVDEAMGMGADHTVCLAFWDGESRGTKHCMTYAANSGLPVWDVLEPVRQLPGQLELF